MTGTCDTNACGQTELLDAVLGAIEQRFGNPKTVQRLRAILSRKVKERTKTVNVDDLRKQLAKVDTQLATARRNMALADGDDLRREYEAVVRELRSGTGTAGRVHPGRTEAAWSHASGTGPTHREGDRHAGTAA